MTRINCHWIRLSRRSFRRFYDDEQTIDDGIDLFAAYGLSANQNSDIIAIATFMVLEQFSDISTIMIEK